LSVLASATATMVGAVAPSAGAPTGVPPAAARAEAAPKRPLLGIVSKWEPRGHWLARLDARSLRPLPGPRTPVGRHGPAWSFSPDWSRLALGGWDVRLVDVKRMRLVDDVPIAGVGYVIATWWPERKRLFAVQQYEGEPWRQAWLVELDPGRRRVVRRTPLRGAVEDVARTREALLLLVSPARSVGRSRLARIGRSGDVGFVALPGIRSGVARSRRLSRVARPALVVDRAGKRAFVVPGGIALAEVDLGTLAVAYRPLQTRRSLLQRLAAWLVPRAWAKGPTAGAVRDAEWVDDGVIAVSGWNGRSAAGLALIDSRRQEVRTVERDASQLATAAGVVLAYGSRRGVRAYDGGGNVLWTRLQGEFVGAVHARGRSVFVHRSGRPLTTILVIDVASGDVLRRVRTPGTVPLFAREGSGLE
jgi:hypothetical protein